MKENRIKILENEIIRHKSLYYSGKPEISDFQYDKLEEELKKLDPQNPVLEIIGTTNLSEEKIEHSEKMLSLDKTYNLEELLKWKKEFELISTFKIDGSSCSIIYKNGKLILGKTRGDGSYGENITKKVLYIEDIPKVIDNKKILEVRGEIYCTEENFFKLSNEMVSLGLEKPMSQRNIVAGILGRKENYQLSKYLSFQAFELIMEKNIYKSESEKLHELQKNKFLIPNFLIHKNEKTISEAINEAQQFMSEGEYLIDGLVFTINDTEFHEELGKTAHHPRYKIAYKFQGDTKVTKIKNLEWSVSRNGILTPVANIEPVELSGAIVSRVTLHNYGMVKQYNLKIGDEIEIIRSGEVIPKFLQVKKSSNNKFVIPNECPSCHHKIKIEEIRLICDNDDCADKKLDEILNFIQKIGIEDISEKRLHEMLKIKLITSIPDLYKLEKDDFLKLEKVKDKLADKFVETISQSKKTDLIKFLSSLGLKGGAYNKCEKIVNAGFNTIDKIMNIEVEELINVDSFAEKSANEFINSLKSKKKLINELIKLGFKFETKKTLSSNLENSSFCITGTLSMKRNDVEKMIKDNGGLVLDTVSKNLSFLVTNDKESSSSKFVKAKKLNIPIINEDQLMEMINGKNKI